jgi:hypothetical protein
LPCSSLFNALVLPHIAVVFVFCLFHSLYFCFAWCLEYGYSGRRFYAFYIFIFGFFAYYYFIFLPFLLIT